MTQEEKELLIEDLCGRLPYKPKCLILRGQFDPDEAIVRGYDGRVSVFLKGDFDEIEPEKVRLYLRPLTDMTKEEKEELCKMCTPVEVLDPDTQEYLITHYYVYFGAKEEDNEEDEISIKPCPLNYFPFNWLNAHQFDYRGLIPRSLAIAVTEENNPYKKHE